MRRARPWPASSWRPRRADAAHGHCRSTLGGLLVAVFWPSPFRHGHPTTPRPPLPASARPAVVTFRSPPPAVGVEGIFGGLLVVAFWLFPQHHSHTTAPRLHCRRLPTLPLSLFLRCHRPARLCGSSAGSVRLHFGPLRTVTATPRPLDGHFWRLPAPTSPWSTPARPTAAVSGPGGCHPADERQSNAYLPVGARRVPSSLAADEGHVPRFCRRATAPVRRKAGLSRMHLSLADVRVVAAVTAVFLVATSQLEGG